MHEQSEFTSREKFTQKVQTLLMQKDFIKAIRGKDISKVKCCLDNPELDINYPYKYPGSSIEVILILH